MLFKTAYTLLADRNNICKVVGGSLFPPTDFYLCALATRLAAPYSPVTFHFLIPPRAFCPVFNDSHHPLRSPASFRENSVTRESLVRGQSVSCAEPLRATRKKELVPESPNCIYAGIFLNSNDFPGNTLSRNYGIVFGLRKYSPHSSLSFPLSDFPKLHTNFIELSKLPQSVEFHANAEELNFEIECSEIIDCR